MLDGRLGNLRVVNCDRKTGAPLDKGGSLSVVFHAFDNDEHIDVAIKFFDPDRQGFGHAYRQTLFAREAKLLEQDLGNGRSISVVQGLREIDLSDAANESMPSISCGYFVTEWLPDDINDYFFAANSYGAIEKLGVFRDVCLAVFAMHRNGLFHRDLKPENFRLAERSGRSQVVVTDYGTAAAIDSEPVGMASDYGGPVGAPAYAPPEAFCGLAAIREIGAAADRFALGCMLYELFNPTLYAAKLRHDSGFVECINRCWIYMQEKLPLCSTSDAALSEWSHIVDLTKRQVELPRLDGPGSSVPPGINPLLQELLHSLTAVSLRDRERISEEWVIRRIDSAARVANNERADAKARDRKQKKRQDRLAQRKAGNKRPRLCGGRSSGME